MASACWWPVFWLLVGGIAGRMSSALVETGAGQNVWIAEFLHRQKRQKHTEVCLASFRSAPANRSGDNDGYVWIKLMRVIEISCNICREDNGGDKQAGKFPKIYAVHFIWHSLASRLIWRKHHCSKSM